MAGNAIGISPYPLGKCTHRQDVAATLFTPCALHCTSTCSGAGEVRELERHARLVDRLKQDSTEGSSTRISVSLAQAFSRGHDLILPEERSCPHTVLGVSTRYVRNVEDAADSCMMLVDTRVEGWKMGEKRLLHCPLLLSHSTMQICLQASAIVARCFEYKGLANMQGIPAVPENKAET
eukprot:scaffold268565_cov20-Tisochrysis_lutea.AAC.3